MTDQRPHLPMVSGNVFRAATFIQLFCICDQQTTPHSVGKVLYRKSDKIKLAVRCRKCGQRTIYTTNQLPDGYEVYHIRVTGEDGPHLPNEFRPVPFVEEEFEVIGSSLQDAHERAEFACTLQFKGHRTTWFLNGVEHLDERF